MPIWAKATEYAAFGSISIYFIYLFIIIIINVDVQTSLRAPRLFLRVLKLMII